MSSIKFDFSLSIDNQGDTDLLLDEILTGLLVGETISGKIRNCSESDELELIANKLNNS